MMLHHEVIVATTGMVWYTAPVMVAAFVLHARSMWRALQRVVRHLFSNR
jgi:hypothetical protein